MILIFHILVALSSLILSAVILFKPTQPKLYTTYALVAATLTSGFYLVLAKPAHMTQTCAEGLVYLGAVSFAVVSARNKLTMK